MAIPTFDGIALTITLPAGFTAIDVVEDLFEPWKDWMLASSNNRRYPPAFRSDGGNPLSAIINQGSYIFLNNSAGWRIKPPEEDTTIYLTGNLAVEDTDLPAFAPTDGAFTAAILGLQPVTQGVSQTLIERLNYNSYQGGVTYDATNGDTLTNYLLADVEIGGSVEYPLNNMTDVLSVITAFNFDKIFIRGNITIDSGVDINSLRLYGQGATPNIAKTTVTLVSGCITSNAHYYNCKIVGYQGGEANYHDCMIDGIENAHCFYERCGFLDGSGLGYTIKQNNGVGIGHASYWKQCFSDEGEAIIDRNGAKMNVIMDGYTGRLKVINQNNATESGQMWIHLTGGTLTIDATCTKGSVTLTGFGTLVNNAVGTNVDSTGFISEEFKQLQLDIESMRETHQGFGERFFVDGVNGNDLNAGTSTQAAVRTVAQAQALCVSGRGDIIYLLGPAAGTANYDERVNITKEDVHLRGPGRGVQFQPSTADLGDVVTLTGNNCSASGFVVRAPVGSTTDNCFTVIGKFSQLRKLYVVGAGAGVGSGSGFVFNAGDYHELHECESEKCGRAALLVKDIAHANNGSPREISVKGGNYYLCPTGIEFEGQGVVGSSNRINRILGANIHDCSGYGVSIDALTSGTLIDSGTLFHNNALGNVNDLGLDTHIENAARDENLVLAIWTHIKALSKDVYLALT